jgi:hypothetical protein
MMKAQLMAGMALSIVLFSSLTTSANAQFSKNAPLVKRPTQSVTIDGALAGNTKPNCNDLDVKILEIRQTGEPGPGDLFPPTRTTTLAKGLATEDGTQCKYSLTFEQPIILERFLSDQQENYRLNRTIEIQVIGRYGWRGNYTYQPKGQLPNQQEIDIAIEQIRLPN